MQEQHQNRHSSLILIAGIVVSVFAVGGITAWWALHTLTDSPMLPVANNTTVTTNPPVNITKQEQGIKIYWLKVTDKKTELLPYPITIEQSNNADYILESALKRLLVAPKNPKYTTTIPKGTQLLDLKVDVDDIHINLSEKFTSGGGSASMTGRLAQILYTATTLDPNAKVWINVEGKPLDVLGGEGITIDQPMTRKDFEENFQL